jgi:hypothetical protein
MVTEKNRKAFARGVIKERRVFQKQKIDQRAKEGAQTETRLEDYAHTAA